MSKFIAASRQAIELDKTRILLETTIKSVRDESKKWAGLLLRLRRRNGAAKFDRRVEGRCGGERFSS